mmetsp:Transcript_7728/g.19225  ORF Transcript_7728/g.19225 Transcript_7728/m.19225 type:complete len:315 (-) Transcript_7728:1140-2084(-)
MCIHDVYGPCSCPHGRCFTAIAQMFVIMSWVASISAMTSCFYVFVRPIPEEGMPEFPKEGFGWMSRQIRVREPPSYGKMCAWYTAGEREEYFDSMWNAGLAMSVFSVVVGLVVMCLVFCTCCVAFRLPMFDGLFWTCMFCFVAQSLTFLSWGSELCTETHECTWSSGTGMNLTALMSWVWAANMVKSFPEALPPKKRRRRQQDDYYDDDDAGDVYLSNRNVSGNEAPYQDEYADDWDSADDNGDGYYDEDGNWVENENYYDEDAGNYDSYDDYEGSNGENAGYDYYDNESSSNWAEESESDSRTSKETKEKVSS